MMGASKFHAIQYSPVTHKIVSTQRLSKNLNLQIKQSCKDCLDCCLHCHNLRELGLVCFMFSTLCVCVYMHIWRATHVCGGVCVHTAAVEVRRQPQVSLSPSPFTLFESEPLFFFGAMGLWLAG